MKPVASMVPTCTAMTDGIGTTGWGYNPLGQVLEVTDPYTGTAAYTYNPAGARAGLTFPDSKAVTYEYDPLGRMERVSAWASQVITYTYSSDSRLLLIERPRDLDTTYTYDLAGRVLAIEHRQGEGLLSAFAYTHDKSGNRIWAVERMGEEGGSGTPETPANFNPSAEGYAAIALRWNDHTDNESGYYLDRSTDSQTWQRTAVTTSIRACCCTFLIS